FEPRTYWLRSVRKTKSSTNVYNERQGGVSVKRVIEVETRRRGGDVKQPQGSVFSPRVVSSLIPSSPRVVSSLLPSSPRLVSSLLPSNFCSHWTRSAGQLAHAWPPRTHHMFS